jgi:hypothetical protein
VSRAGYRMPAVPMIERLTSTQASSFATRSGQGGAVYRRLIALSEHLLNRLRPLGAKDLIDVQSFMWIVVGSPAANGR